MVRPVLSPAFLTLIIIYKPPSDDDDSTFIRLHLVVQVSKMYRPIRMHSYERVRDVEGTDAVLQPVRSRLFAEGCNHAGGFSVSTGEIRILLKAGRRAGGRAGRQASSTYLLHGQEQRPQNFPRSFKFFSASFMSLLIWSIPSSMRSSCSD